MSERNCPVCGREMHRDRNPKWLLCSHLEQSLASPICLPTDFVTYADRLVAENAALKAKVEGLEKETGLIKQICDNIDEFNEPMHPDFELPELADRVFGTIADQYDTNAALRKEIEGMKKEAEHGKSDN